LNDFANGNKKAQHPVGLFYIFDAFGLTPVEPAFSIAVICYFYLEHPARYGFHDSAQAWIWIFAKSLNCCTFRRTKLAEIYPDIYPQKLRIVSEL